MLWLDDVDVVLPIFGVVLLKTDVDGLFEPDAVALTQLLLCKVMMSTLSCAIFSRLLFDVM